MAKRFTDTGKWDKAWFRKLSPEMKCAWIFLCDRCDHAGIWEVDLDALQFFIGADLSLDDLTQAFGERLIFAAGNKVLLEGFSDFQYGNLNPENRVHKSILDRVEKLALRKGLRRSLKGSMDMDMEMDKEMEMDKGESEGEKFRPNLGSIYSRYPRKVGKTKGLAKLKTDLQSPGDFADCVKALENFIAHHKSAGTEAEFIPHFKTWTSSWRDWLDPSHGSSETFAEDPTQLSAEEKAVFENASNE